MTQYVTLQPCTDGLSPLYTSRFPAGDRGNDARDIIYVGSTTHGNAAQLITKGGVNIFTPAPAQHHVELAGTFHYQGSSVDPALAWDQNSFSVETSNLRAANIIRMYKGLGVGRLSFGYQDSLIPAENKNLYLSYHAKFGCDPFRVYTASVASKTGDLQGGADRSRGERCTIVQSAGGTISGWVTYENGNYVSVEVDSGASIAGMKHASITGISSGNVVVTGDSSTSVGATKYSRIFHGKTNDSNRSAFVTSHTSAGMFDFDTWQDGVLNNHADVDAVNLGRMQVGSWVFIENEYGYSDNSWHVIIKINGATWLEKENVYGLDLGTEGIRPVLIGLDTPGTGGLPVNDIGTSEWIDSIVYQNNLSRIVLTDNQNYASSTKFEVQRYTSFGGDRIDFILNRGEIASGGWLHIFDDAGAHMSSVEVG